MTKIFVFGKKVTNVANFIQVLSAKYLAAA